MKEYLIDTHAHIDMIIDESKTDLKDIINDMAIYNIKKAIIPAVDCKTQENIIKLANSEENIYAMIGLFPDEVKTYTPEYEKNLEELSLRNKKVVAVGEIGLDYYWDKSFAELQKEVFRKQIRLANRLALPVVIHDREAHKDCFDILIEEKPQNGVLFHCFSGSVEFMKECTKQGWYIALGGVVTFKNAVKMKEVAKEVPPERLMLETDSPYLTPVPYRGKPNKPGYVKFVAEEIAKIKEIPLAELINITTENAERFFKI